METTNDQSVGTESKAQLVEKINACLRSGQYSRALDILRAAAAEFPNDAELSELEKSAHNGANRNAEAQRLITESQDLFAQRKSAEAIQLLRKAYELDKTNSLARSILANALVEHAQSIVETDWLEAEKLANQALNLNPAHPTAKRILNQIVGKKETSPVSEWVAQARKLQSSGDLFAALAWVAEGLAVHPHEPKLLQIQDEIQRDQDARRRQARRGDLEDLRRMQKEIEGAVDVAAKQALAERIQGVAAKHWTDGEILSIANALLLRLGLVAKESSSGSARAKGATLILHVPRPNSPVALPTDARLDAQSEIEEIEVSPPPAKRTQASPIQTRQAPPPPSSDPVIPTSESLAAVTAPATKIPMSVVPGRVTPKVKVGRTLPKPEPYAPQAASDPTTKPSPPVAKFTTPSAQQKQPASSNAAMLAVISVAALALVATTFFLTRRHYTTPAATSPETPQSSSATSAPASASSTTAPSASTSSPSPAASVAAPAQTVPLPVQPDEQISSPGAGRTPSDASANIPPDRLPAKPVHNVGELLVVTGQDDARVFLNGKPQPQLTQNGQLHLPNLELKEYAVQVLKTGFQDPPPQKIRIRGGEQTKLVFNLQPLPRLASLSIRGGEPGTTVLVDQTSVGTVSTDGNLSVSTISPGDHTVGLLKDRFKPRQFKKRFVAGETISLLASDALLEAAPSELKITFAPVDASVAISKGDLPTVVHSGVPISLAAGTYTLTARTSDGFTRFSTFAVAGGQLKTLDLSLAPNGMSKWDNPGTWKQEGDSFTHKGGEFVLYGVAPASGTFTFSVMLTKGHMLQWVLDYVDAKNYVLFQMDDKNFFRTVIRNGEKADQITIPERGDRKSFRSLRIRVSPTELVNQIKQGNSWVVLDRWTQAGTNLGLGKFGFYLTGDDQIALSTFAHYPDLTIR